jgi:hypothetical protein
LFPGWLFPTWLTIINNSLSAIGTYILIIPLSIIITSFMAQSKWLNIASLLFSVSLGLVTIMLRLSQGTLGTLKEYVNLKLVMIYHIKS